MIKGLKNNLLSIVLASATWLSGATGLTSRAYSQSYIQQDKPKSRKEVPYVIQIENPLTEEKGVKLNITSALDYTLGQDSGTAYLDISAENGSILKINELWLIFPNYIVPSFKIKKGHDKKYTEVKETAFREAAAYFMDKLPGIATKGLPVAGTFAKGILDVSKEVEKKQEKERRMDLESIVDIDESLASLLKRPESILEKTISVKIPFTVQRKQIEIETEDGFVTGTYPSSRTNPANELYAVFSLAVMDYMNISEKAENIGMNWRDLEEAVKDEVKYGDLSNPKSALYTYEAAVIKQDMKEIERVIAQKVDDEWKNWHSNLEDVKKAYYEFLHSDFVWVEKGYYEHLGSSISHLLNNNSDFNKLWKKHVSGNLSMIGERSLDKLTRVYEGTINSEKIDEIVLEFWKKIIEKDLKIEEIDENAVLIKGSPFNNWLIISEEGDGRKLEWKIDPTPTSKEEAIEHYKKYYSQDETIKN